MCVLKGNTRTSPTSNKVNKLAAQTPQMFKDVNNGDGQHSPDLVFNDGSAARGFVLSFATMCCYLCMCVDERKRDMSLNGLHSL